MKKILSMMICAVMVASFATSPLKASASTSSAGQNEQLIQLLMQMITMLQAQLAVLTNGSNTHDSNDDSNDDDSSDEVSGSINNSSLTAYSENPTITGTAAGVSTVGFSIDDGGKIYGSGQFAVVNGKWSHTISTDLDPGNYGIHLYGDNNDELDRETLKVIKSTNGEENLTIHSTSLSLPNGIGHTSIAGIPVPDQKVTVEVKNNEFGSFHGTGEKINYAAYLYEVDDSGHKIKTSEKVTGEVLAPYANGYSSFEFYIAGGLVFGDHNEEGDMERVFQIKVVIDTDDEVDESNEDDNEGWSDEWDVSYYKG